VVVRVDGGALYLIEAAIGRLLRGGTLAVRDGRVLLGLDLLQASRMRFVDRRDPATPKHFGLLRQGDRWLAGERAIAGTAVVEIFASLEGLDVDHYWPRGSPALSRPPYAIHLELPGGEVVLELEPIANDQVRVACTRDGATLRGVATQAHAQAIAALVRGLADQAR
jgi:hypothetical protein